MRAVSHSPGATRSGWTADDDTPWIRRTDLPANCYFFGKDTVIVSMGDLRADRCEHFHLMKLALVAYR